MQRRDFIAGALTAVCSLPGLNLKGSGRVAFDSNTPDLSPAADVSQAIKALYKRSLILDGLCSPVDTGEDKLPLKPELTRQCMDSGIDAVNWTVSFETFEATMRAISYAHALVDSDPEHWRIVRRHSDIESAKREGKIGLILGFQYTQPFEQDLNRLTIFQRLGVRIIQMTYNTRSLLGDGCLEPANAGLSRRGREALSRMNELGIAVDVSHCGKRTTAESIQSSSKPVLITHSACNAVYRHPRHKDDEDMRSLADRGGVFGVYLMPYLTPSPLMPSKQDVIFHIEHALDVCGADHVGIGSDNTISAYDDSPEQLKRFQAVVVERKRLGISAPGEDRPLYVPDLNTPHRMLLIADELHRRGHSDGQIEKILGLNFQRVLGDIWGRN